MSPEDFQWPTRDDYDLAMKDLQHSAVDPELRTGRVTHDSLGSIAHYGGANLYAAMYKVTEAERRILNTTTFHKPYLLP
jgi:hypothetical protein